MGGPGSGRRPESKRDEPPKPFALPPLGNTEESIMDALDALWLGVASGDIHGGVAVQLERLARAKLAAIRQRNGRDEVATLEARLDKLEADREATRQRVAAERMKAKR